MILVCHVGPIDARVLDALDGHAVTREITPNDPSAYCDEIERAWALCANLGQDLVMIEHDVVLSDDTMEMFSACESAACAFPYWTGHSYTIGLGCVRFRKELIREHPTLITKAGDLCDDCLPPRHWKRLDTRIYRTLEGLGIDPCTHVPPVEHLHEYPLPDAAEYPARSDSA